MYQKSKENGHTVTSSGSSIHKDALSDSPNASSVAINTPPVTVQCTASTATGVAVRTNSQPCAKEDPSDHPKEAEPSLQEIQAHHQGEEKHWTQAKVWPLAYMLHPPAHQDPILQSFPQQFMQPPLSQQ